MFDGRVDGLYIILISLHGLVRGDKMELGKDADTGGQVCVAYCWQPSAPGLAWAGRRSASAGGMGGLTGGSVWKTQVGALLAWSKGIICSRARAQTLAAGAALVAMML